MLQLFAVFDRTVVVNGREKVWQSGIAEGTPWPMHCMIRLQDTLFGFFRVRATRTTSLRRLAVAARIIYVDKRLCSIGNFRRLAGGPAMSVVIRSTLLAGLCIGIAITAAAEKASSKWSPDHGHYRAAAARHSSTAHHGHHRGGRDSSAAVLRPSRQMDADLSRLENQAAKTVGSQRSAERAHLPSGKLRMARDRGSNPPINFQYKGPKNSIGRHSSAPAGRQRVGIRRR